MIGCRSRQEGSIEFCEGIRDHSPSDRFDIAGVVTPPEQHQFQPEAGMVVVVMIGVVVVVVVVVVIVVVVVVVVVVIVVGNVAEDGGPSKLRHHLPSMVDARTTLSTHRGSLKQAWYAALKGKETNNKKQKQAAVWLLYERRKRKRDNIS